MLAMAASSTPRADGGMIIANPPVPRIGPMDIRLLYPRRCISGTISDPSMAVFAIDDPVSVENIEPPATVRKHRRPGSFPNSASSPSKTLIASPV